MVLEIEVQGARQVRGAMPDAVQVFIAPPSPGGAAGAPRGPRDGQPEQIARRLAVADEELAARDEFGREIVNDDLDRAADELAGAGALDAGRGSDGGGRS